MWRLNAQVESTRVVFGRPLGRLRPLAGRGRIGALPGAGGRYRAQRGGGAQEAFADRFLVGKDAMQGSVHAGNGMGVLRQVFGMWVGGAIVGRMHGMPFT